MDLDFDFVYKYLSLSDWNPSLSKIITYIFDFCICIGTCLWLNYLALYLWVGMHI